MSSAAPIERVRASAYTIPTETPESDGTLTWKSTTLVTAEVDAGGATGLGYTDSHAAARDAIGEAAELTGRR